MTTNGLSSQIIVNFMLTSLTVCSKMINPVHWLDSLIWDSLRLSTWLFFREVSMGSWEWYILVSRPGHQRGMDFETIDLNYLG